MILKQCKTIITPQEMLDIEAAMPALVEIMRLRGEITEDEMDELNIRKCKDKDDLVLYRRRSILLVHPDVIKKEANKVTAIYASLVM